MADLAKKAAKPMRLVERLAAATAQAGR